MSTLEQHVREALNEALASLKQRLPFTAPEAADPLWIEISGDAVLAGIRRWFTEQLDQVAEQIPGVSVEFDRTPLIEQYAIQPLPIEMKDATVVLHPHCAACGLIQPLIQLREFHPDGAPDAVDYVCRDWQACGMRVAENRLGRHSR